MTSTSPIDCCRTHLGALVPSIFDTMFRLSIQSVAVVPEKFAGAFTGAVYYAGTWQGALLLECSATQASAWAARYLSLPPPVDPEDARECLGELTNVIAGNLKALLPPQVGISIPSVVLGGDYSLRVLGDHLRETACFEDELGLFRITFVQVNG